MSTADQVDRRGQLVEFEVGEDIYVRDINQKRHVLRKGRTVFLPLEPCEPGQVFSNVDGEPLPALFVKQKRELFSR